MAYSTHHTETILDSAARTATANGAAQINQNARGALVFVDISAVTGTNPTLVVKLQVKDPVSGNWADMLGAATASLTGTGTTLMAVYPGITASTNVSVSQVLPLNWRAVWTIGGTATPTFTFSIGVQYVL